MYSGGAPVKKQVWDFDKAVSMASPGEFEARIMKI